MIFALTLFCSAAQATSVNGPGTWDGEYVGPDSVSIFDEKFYKGREATIELAGDCDSDIDLWVYDEYDNLIAKSTT